MDFEAWVGLACPEPYIDLIRVAGRHFLMAAHAALVWNCPDRKRRGVGQQRSLLNRLLAERRHGGKWKVDPLAAAVSTSGSGIRP